MYCKVDSHYHRERRTHEVNEQRALQPSWVLRRKGYRTLAPGLPDYALGQGGWIQPRPKTHVSRGALTPTLRSNDIYRDYLKWQHSLQKFDAFVTFPKRPQYLAASDLTRTEVRPFSSYCHASLPLPALRTRGPILPTSESSTSSSEEPEESDSDSDEELYKVSDVTLRPWTKGGPGAKPPREVLAGERTCGRRMGRDSRWFENMAKTNTGRIVRAETMGFEMLRP
ncbi:hypothetical protein BSKO_06608 [Bryopsis sp. KO-2023]|nr:hypothetical protein BSKO_06608 [Bryopsis sp. KO-2023]